MTKLHILDALGGHRYRAVAHYAAPAGNNAAGVSWKNAIVGAKLNVSSLAEGSGAGQINTAELADVVTGDVVEAAFVMQDDPALGGAARIALAAALADKAIAEHQAHLARQLRYFGFTVDE